MNALLKRAKDMFVVLFGTVGLMLVLFPLIIMIVLKRGVLKFWHGLVVKIKNMRRNSFALVTSQLSKQNSKKETNKHENKQDIMPG